MRHGQCQANVSGTILGWLDSALTIEGRKQAASLYPAFLANQPLLSHKPLASDLTRARETLRLALSFP